MSTWHALFYPIKAGSEETVKELFRNSGRPNFEVTDADGKVVGKLLATMAFVGTEAAIRVIHVEGPLPLELADLGLAAHVRGDQRQLEEHLSEPRDMVSPEGARAFFQKAGMENVLARTAPGVDTEAAA